MDILLTFLLLYTFYKRSAVHLDMFVDPVGIFLAVVKARFRYKIFILSKIFFSKLQENTLRHNIELVPKVRSIAEGRAERVKR